MSQTRLLRAECPYCHGAYGYLTDRKTAQTRWHMCSTCLVRVMIPEGEPA